MRQYLLTKHRSDKLHEREIAEFLLVACLESNMRQQSHIRRTAVRTRHGPLALLQHGLDSLDDARVRRTDLVRLLHP